MSEIIIKELVARIMSYAKLFQLKLFQLIKLHLNLAHLNISAKNSVEVYIRNGGAKSRCSQLCSNSLKDDDAHLTMHQIQSNSHETTPSFQSDSTRSNAPNLRR